MDTFRKNYYSPTQQYQEINLRAFIEGSVNPPSPTPVNSTGIKTTEIDQFRQGVEMTLDKHNVGMYKISAGTPGHIISPNCFGTVNVDILESNFNKDLDYFDPVYYVRAQEPGVDFSKIFTFPIVISSDFNQSENFSMNGVIEPLSIRPVTSFSSIEFPNESHRIRGNMMGGNNDPWYGSSDRILTVDYVPKKLSKSSRSFQNDDVFLDSFPSVTSSYNQSFHPQSYLDAGLNKLTAFVDSQIYVKLLGMSPEKNGEDILNVFLATTSSMRGENYITPDKRSSTSGFVYDNTMAGTDSIVYGGLTY